MSNALQLVQIGLAASITKFVVQTTARQVLLKFPSGYGASIINHEFSYGTELAVIKFKEDSLSFDLVYDTPITGDVIGHIKSVEELLGYLEQIKNLTITEEIAYETL